MHREFTAADAARFWAKVDRRGPDECWLWTAARFSNGYGAFRHGPLQRRSHRVSYEIAHGPVADDALVCHSCDTPACVNPAHLWLGSHADNHADRNAKGRQARGDRNGSRTRPERLKRGAEWAKRNKPESIARGERIARAKLTENEVRQIRALYATGQYSSPQLGRQFGISHHGILAIVHHVTWKHVT